MDGNPEHLEVVRQGKQAIDDYRRSHRDICFDLRGADLNNAMFWEANLNHADFRGANLYAAKLNYSNVAGADFRGADLRHATFTSALVRGANLSNANLREACLVSADLERADFRGADLRSGLLHGARCIKTRFGGADLSGCTVYGVSVWDVDIDDETVQKDLVITPNEVPRVTVDNLKVAQFIYMLINNSEIRSVIETITSKVVLILGRFTEPRKVVLDSIREELRRRNYVPVLFDFQKPNSLTLTETITMLARMSRFVIADLTDAKSIPQELLAIVPHLPSVPVQPLIQADDAEYGMFESFKPYPWVLPTYVYRDQKALLDALADRVVQPAERWGSGRHFKPEAQTLRVDAAQLDDATGDASRRG